MRRPPAALLALLVAACATAPPAGRAALPTVGPPDYDPALLQKAGVPPAALHCNRENRWGATLRRDSDQAAAELLKAIDPSLALQSDEARETLRRQIKESVFWRLVRAVLIEGDNQNFGVLPLRGHTYVDRAGVERPVLVFRSGFTPAPDQPGSCFASLLGAGGVRHVVNLFDGDIPVEDLVSAEAHAAAEKGATYHVASDGPDGYGPWRDTLRKHYDDARMRRQATESVARLVREQVLLPDGAAPKGNLHIHCGGGMHRTGIVVGVIERCVNHEPMETVEAHYRYHVGWRDAEHPGGFEEGNLKFLRDFDCDLLKPR